MQILRWSCFFVVACISQGWSDSLKHYEGVVGSRQAEFSLAWGEGGSVKGSYFCPDGKQVQYGLLGDNKVEGVLELNEYTGTALTARLSLKKNTEGGTISWVGTLKNSDGRVLAVNFSRKSDADSEQMPKSATLPSSIDREDRPSADDKVVKDSTNGALVWRPNSGNIQWSGEVNGKGFAEGKGTLVVFDRKGNRSAIFTCTMRDGHLVGDVTAKYPASADRAHYVGGYSNWSENGMGTMTYNNGKVVNGSWKNGELVATGAPNLDQQSLLSGNQPHHSPGVNPSSQEPDPDTAADDLQKTYDRLKGRLQGDALQDLKVCQRAWIKYNETALQIASSIWDKPNDHWEGEDRFDALIAMHRTREIQYITDCLFGPQAETQLPADIDAQVTLMADKFRSIHANAKIKPALMATLKTQWDQSCQLAKLANYGNIPQSKRQETAKGLLALATKNLNEVLDSWLNIHEEIAQGNPLVDEVAKSAIQQERGSTPNRGIIGRESIDKTNSAGLNAGPSPPVSQKENHKSPNILDRQNSGDNPQSAIIGKTEAERQPEADVNLKPANPPNETWLMVGYIALAVFLTISMIGVYMGVNESITIYNGKQDFTLTCFGAVAAIMALIFYAYENTQLSIGAIIITCVILVFSYRESRIANDTVLRAIFSLTAKFILLGFLAACGLLAVGGARSGMDELKKGNKEKAAAQFAIAAVAALGAKYFHSLINRLIKERVTREIQQVPLED